MKNIKFTPIFSKNIADWSGGGMTQTKRSPYARKKREAVVCNG